MKRYKKISYALNLRMPAPQKGIADCFDGWADYFKIKGYGEFEQNALHLADLHRFQKRFYPNVFEDREQRIIKTIIPATPVSYSTNPLWA